MGASMLLLLLLSHFSRVQLCATPQRAAHQAPPSLGFSRQEHWGGVPFPSPMHKSEKWKCSRLVVSTSQRPYGQKPARLLRPWDSQRKRVLGWGAIAFSSCRLLKSFKNVVRVWASAKCIWSLCCISWAVQLLSVLTWIHLGHADTVTES